MTWVLLPEGALGPTLPPIAYVPRLNLKAHGGPQAFGLATLARLGREPMDIPIARDLAAQLTAVDVDLLRPSSDPAGRVAGYRNSAGPDDERFTAWRAAAARHGRILVISGSRDLLPRDDTSEQDLLDVIRASHGALVLLTRESAPETAPAPSAASAGAHSSQGEYSDMLTAKMRALESIEVRIDPAVTDLIGQNSLSQWLTHLWPVACQTCGDPLGSKADISADGNPASSHILISTHHSACRPSGVTPADGPTVKHQLTVSVAAGYIGKGPRPQDIPVMVVNPSCEQLLLERDRTGGWRNATLDEFAALGLAPATENIPPCIEQMQAELSGEQLSVTVTGGQAAGHEWVITPPAHVREQVRRLRGLAICLITKTLPALLLPEHLPSALADPDALVGWVHLSALPRPGGGRLCGFPGHDARPGRPTAARTRRCRTEGREGARCLRSISRTGCAASPVAGPATCAHARMRARWWEIPDSTLDGYAALILAVAGNVIAGVFEVRGWRRDPGADNKVVFDLADAPAWQWLVGQESPRPLTWRKSQVNPVRKVGGVIADELRARRPHHSDAGHGWSLDVDPNGNAAVVCGPGRIAVTALDNGTARLCLMPASPTGPSKLATKDH